jgi:hypothetical protein
MSKPLIGVCMLCQQARELRESHFVPKALYRLLRAVGSLRKPDPVLLTAAGRQQTSFQATAYLLCADCEERFDRNGEEWVMRHCYRGRDRFRLRTLLEQSAPVDSWPDGVVSCASAVSEVDIERLVYFCTSVFWRAAVRDWESSGQKYEAISLGAKYQKEIRQYLLGNSDFPKNAVVTIIVSQLKRPALVFNFPDTVRVESSHCHTLHIPGIAFQLLLGNQVLHESAETCTLRSPLHPIFVCKDGDARVQRNILKLMGKAAPPWGKYPVIEGVV